MTQITDQAISPTGRPTLAAFAEKIAALGLDDPLADVPAAIHAFAAASARSAQRIEADAAVLKKLYQANGAPEQLRAPLARLQRALPQARARQHKRPDALIPPAQPLAAEWAELDAHAQADAKLRCIRIILAILSVQAARPAQVGQQTLADAVQTAVDWRLLCYHADPTVWSNQIAHYLRRVTRAWNQLALAHSLPYVDVPDRRRHAHRLSPSLSHELDCYLAAVSGSATTAPWALRLKESTADMRRKTLHRIVDYIERAGHPPPTTLADLLEPNAVSVALTAAQGRAPAAEAPLPAEVRTVAKTLKHVMRYYGDVPAATVALLTRATTLTSRNLFQPPDAAIQETILYAAPEHVRELRVIIARLGRRAGKGKPGRGSTEVARVAFALSLSLDTLATPDELAKLRVRDFTFAEATHTTSVRWRARVYADSDLVQSVPLSTATTALLRRYFTHAGLWQAGSQTPVFPGSRPAQRARHLATVVRRVQSTAPVSDRTVTLSDIRNIAAARQILRQPAHEYAAIDALGLSCPRSFARRFQSIIDYAHSLQEAS